MYGTACVQATSKPCVDTIQERLSLARAHIIERSPVWNMLKDAKLGKQI